MPFLRVTSPDKTQNVASTHGRGKSYVIHHYVWNGSRPPTLERLLHQLRFRQQVSYVWLSDDCFCYSGRFEGCFIGESPFWQGRWSVSFLQNEGGCPTLKHPECLTDFCLCFHGLNHATALEGLFTVLELDDPRPEPVHWFEEKESHQRSIRVDQADQLSCSQLRRLLSRNERRYIFKDLTLYPDESAVLLEQPQVFLGFDHCTLADEGEAFVNALEQAAQKGVEKELNLVLEDHEGLLFDEQIWPRLFTAWSQLPCQRTADRSLIHHSLLLSWCPMYHIRVPAQIHFKSLQAHNINHPLISAPMIMHASAAGPSGSIDSLVIGEFCMSFSERSDSMLSFLTALASPLCRLERLVLLNVKFEHHETRRPPSELLDAIRQNRSLKRLDLFWEKELDKEGWNTVKTMIMNHPALERVQLRINWDNVSDDDPGLLELSETEKRRRAEDKMQILLEKPQLIEFSSSDRFEDVSCLYSPVNSCEAWNLFRSVTNPKLLKLMGQSMKKRRRDTAEEGHTRDLLSLLPHMLQYTERMERPLWKAGLVGKYFLLREHAAALCSFAVDMKQARVN